MVSKCCKSYVDVLEGECRAYYICQKCHKPCDLVNPEEEDEKA